MNSIGCDICVGENKGTVDSIDIVKMVRERGCGQCIWSTLGIIIKNCSILWKSSVVRSLSFTYLNFNICRPANPLWV